jgi:hypothetical protein
MKDFSKGFRQGNVIVVIADGVQVPTQFKSINKAKFANRSLKLSVKTKADKVQS